MMRPGLNFIRLVGMKAEAEERRPGSVAGQEKRSCLLDSGAAETRPRAATITETRRNVCECALLFRLLILKSTLRSRIHLLFPFSTLDETKWPIFFVLYISFTLESKWLQFSIFISAGDTRKSQLGRRT